MKQKAISGIKLTLLLGTLCIMLNVRLAVGWSNGGYSADPSNPDYGTHDWIAQHALDWLPTQEKQYILDNLATYLYGTELPDNGEAPDGIGDAIQNHHIYYNSAEVITDDKAAVRASTEYNNTLSFLEAKDYAKAAKNAGIMSHYIVDVAVFGHVMGSGTDWGEENKTYHEDYERYVNVRTNNYVDDFNSFLFFDGVLNNISAYDAAKNLAYDTTFDIDGDLTCVWMDQNYNWSNLTFKNRAGESLNLAVNYLTDVLHTLYLDSDTTPPVTTDNYDDLWHTQDFTITLTATDDISGVAETYYRINGGQTENVSACGQPHITIESANNTLEYWSIDNTGIEELPHKILTEIKLDKTCSMIETPSRMPDGDISPDQSVKVSVNATDATSGIKNVTLFYVINEGTAWTDLSMNYNWSNNLYETTILGQPAGTLVRYKIVAFDYAGNNATKDGTEPYCAYQVIPEFSSNVALSLLIVLSLTTTALARRKQSQHRYRQS